jgi:redox-sensitive bicupin YhaK (pirin superfamily)
MYQWARVNQIQEDAPMQTTSKQKTIKTLRNIQRSAGSHWVGDGFPVRTLLSYHDLGPELSPFLLLDYAGPVEFAPTTARLGVGEHPHRGFETVTIVYAGEVEHRDSSGGGGSIGPGDVQWMTAASGVVHEEFHGRGFAQRGGLFEMVQLWVNLPAKDKMTAPRYQNILNGQIPSVSLPDGQGSVRVIAGEFAGKKGPAKTHTPIHVWDLRLASDQAFDLAVPEGYTTTLVVLKGTVHVQGYEAIKAAEVGLFERAGETLRIDSAQNATALLLMGAPIEEPIVGSGPFVMNTTQEIRQAMRDYQSGKMGHLS